MFDFKNTEAAKGVSYMTPGVYALKPVKVELGTFPKGTKYLGVTFENEDEVQITEKFVLSEKAIGRLQYLHLGFFGKNCVKQFKSEGEVEAYFRKYLTEKEIVKNIIIGGEISGANLYASFPYTNFIDEEGALDLGEFEEGSEEWKKYVKKRTGATSEVSDQGNGLLNDSDDDDSPIGGGKSEPVPAPKSKKEEKPKAGGKAATKKEEKEEPAADDNDMPW